MKRTIAGYTDRISAAPGERIAFKISVEDEVASYHAQVVRLICTDSHREGPGQIERPVGTPVDGEHPARRQRIHCGSYASVPDFPELASFTLQTFVWPTLLGGGRQSLLGHWNEAEGSGAVLEIDARGEAAVRLGLGDERDLELTSGVALLEREWAFLAASYDGQTGELSLYQELQRRYPGIEGRVRVAGHREPTPNHQFRFAPFTIAARGQDRAAMRAHFNGKIDRPRVATRALTRKEMRDLCAGHVTDALRRVVAAAWDFALETPTDRVVDVSGNHRDGHTVNLPARAMTGHNWNGDVHDWRAAPEQYGAIHFHDDDVYDACWQTDFTLDLPDDIESGVYAARLASDGAPEHVVFYVRPALGRPTAETVFLASTATYMAYGNYQVMLRDAAQEAHEGALLIITPEDLYLNEHPEYGGSLYQLHRDGSGVCYSSRLRPLLSMRPNTQLWQFAGDGYLTYWLDKLGQRVDVITDEDLDHEGFDLIRTYRVLITGNHPEYWTSAMRDAVEGYTDAGGRLMYLGGNGFHSRIAYGGHQSGVIELRRAEGGSWAAEPGEYHLSFNGERSGLWRHARQAPNRLVGVGMSAEGFDRGAHYRREPGSFDPRAAFIFEGIGPDERIGDFGFAGGGAAGQEIDLHDPDLGSPPHALVLATSKGHHNDKMLLSKENYSHTTLMLGGTENDRVRADMVFFETPNGGAVFSTGSISWIASLAHQDCTNNVSRITRNVLERFLDPHPFEP